MSYYDEEVKFYKSDGTTEWVRIVRDDYDTVGVYDIDSFNDNYFYCESCDEVCPIDEMHSGIYEDTGDCVCEYCADRHYAFCEGHERWEGYSPENLIYVEEVGYCCDDYVSQYCHFCDECGCTFADDNDGRYSERRGLWICEGCWDEERDGEIPDEQLFENLSADASELGRVCCYHTSAHNRLKSTFLPNIVDGEVSIPDIKTDLISGFELEVHNNGGNSTADMVRWVSEQLNEKEPYVVFENDCTIDPGFEMISRPASNEEHMRRFEKLKEVCAELVHRGFNSHNSNKCGLHIHLNKKFFGNSASKIELAEAKFLYIFLKHWENMVRFSRRKNFDWCSKTYKGSYKYKDLVKSSNTRGHNTAINLANRNTIELRLWRGTLNPETLEATFKFTWRLALLVKTKNICEIANMTFEELLGDDPVVLSYWERVKDRELPAGYNNN